MDNHEEFGKFESRFEIPATHNPIKAKVTLGNGILRIEAPSGKRTEEIMPGPIPLFIKFSGRLPKPTKMELSYWASAPHPMLIYCNGCGKQFDIVVSKGTQNYCCPHCSKVQTFDLEVFANQALEQSQKMV